MAAVKFFMDENMPPAVAEQLRIGGIDVSSLHALEIFSEGDPNLLELATAESRVICTRDADYVRMARAGAQHAGIVFFEKGQRNIGYIVRSLRHIADERTSAEMRNLVEFR
ncbi:MAG: DUF5615 family PIN-like protein [Chloroflexi bacterium]|nr:DUF5615 family PIN-like protein [Chloroflexota bacterium]